MDLLKDLENGTQDNSSFLNLMSQVKKLKRNTKCTSCKEPTESKEFRCVECGEFKVYKD